MRLIRPASLLCVCLAVVALPRGDAHAQPADHASRGYQLFMEGKLDDALRELELAYRESPEPNLLFALGRVHAARKDCVRALDHYRRYLDTQPGPKATDAAQAEIEKCKLPPAPPPAAPPVVELPPPETAPPPVVARAAPKRSLFGTLIRDRFVQGGLVVGVIAGGTFVYALREACWNLTCEGMSHSEFLRRQDRAPKLGVAAGVIGSVAGVLVLTGVLRYALRDDDDAHFEAAIAPTSDGGAVVLSGRF